MNDPFTLDPPAVYRPVAAARWPMLLVILALHGVAIALLLSLDMIPIVRARDRSLTVNLFAIAPPPQPVPAHPVKELPSARAAPTPVTPVPTIVTPVAIVRMAAPDAPSIATSAVPVVVEPPPAPLAPPNTPVAVRIVDLDAHLLAAKPPRYPIESRRKREVGTVVLMVDLAEDGRVRSVVVERSSGHDRLDRAAVRAVQDWRWSPTLVDGRKVEVRGRVRIPFVLEG